MDKVRVSLGEIVFSEESVESCGVIGAYDFCKDIGLIMKGWVKGGAMVDKERKRRI
jgi:hypothetical protein